MIITPQITIGEIVAQDYRTAPVFQSYKIDFCCQGNRTIEDVCKNAEINEKQLAVALEKATQQEATVTANYREWPLQLLADYIERKHHRFVKAKIKEIRPLLRKIVSVHGHKHSELTEVETLFHLSAKELLEHMQKEEQELFPFIRKMAKAKELDKNLGLATTGIAENTIITLHHEHAAEGERFRKIALLTGNYVLPEDGCTTYAATLLLLKEFEQDLYLHIHLENNILFPRTIELEKTYYACYKN